MCGVLSKFRKYPEKGVWWKETTGHCSRQRRFIFLQVADCQECIRALPVITLNYSNFNDAARLPAAKHNGRICERLDKETNREYP